MEKRYAKKVRNRGYGPEPGKVIDEMLCGFVIGAYCCNVKHNLFLSS
jgi:tRNA isopentenyl-2-thiomethyl-A-37 hydroxylase MiaE